MIAPTPTTPALTLPRRSPRAIARPSVFATTTSPRFTVDGSAELEAHLLRTCEKIAAGVRGLLPRGKLEALLLGGGYGRGEGGVLRGGAGVSPVDSAHRDGTARPLDRPYNDLEFYVCVRGNRHLNERRFGRALHVLGEILTPQAGVEVEFKITSLAELRRGPVSMFSYDLVRGHRWLIGREELLAGCEHHGEAEEIPVSEGTRLLMNRCTGLLLAREKLQRPEFTANDADFVARNIAKAELALGDAVLVAHAHYHWSVRERHRLLERLARTETQPWLPDVRRHHARGVEFKLHPFRSAETRETLLGRHAAVTALAEQVWLWLESRRLAHDFASITDYATTTSIDKWPTQTPLRNALVHVKALGARPLREGRATQHPRGRVLTALGLLLWEPRVPQTPALLQHVQRELQTDAADFRGLMAAYRRLWPQVH